MEGIVVDFESQGIQLLKLMKAFFKIKSPATRRVIVALTESMAAGATVPSPYFEQMKNLLRQKTT